MGLLTLVPIGPNLTGRPGEVLGMTPKAGVGVCGDPQPALRGSSGAQGQSWSDPTTTNSEESERAVKRGFRH